MAATRRTSRPRAQTPEEGGGAGGTFEEWVVAWYLLQLLRGGPVRGLGTLRHVATQTRPEGWLLDDIRLHLAAGGRERRVAIECKSGRFLTAAGVPDRETVDRAWRLLVGSANPAFEERHDVMLLVVRRPDGLSAWRALEKAAAGGAASVRRAAQGAVKERLLAGLQPPADLGLTGDDGDPARLLANLRVVHLELGDEGDEHDDEAVRRCGHLLDDPAEARKLWDTLGRLARRRQHAFEFSQASLVTELRKEHRLRVLPDHQRVLDELLRWAADDFPTRPSHIGGVHVSRLDLLAKLRDAVAAHPLVALTGGSGVGKTGIVRDLTPGALGVDAVLTMRASRLTSENVQRIAAALLAHPGAKGVLVIDAVDRDLRSEGADRVAALLRTVLETVRTWSVVLVSTDAAWGTVWSQISRLANALAAPVRVEVGPFTAAEVEQVLAPLEACLPAAARERLHPVLSNAWSLDRVVDTVLSGVDLPLSGAIGHAALGRLWWNRTLDAVDPDGSARAQALLLAPVFADTGGSVRPTPPELATLAPLVARGVLERRDRAVQFAHARFEEVALARGLVEADGAGSVAQWRSRSSSLRWRPALILAGAEIAEGDADRWTQLVGELDPRSAIDADVLTLLLEALLHTPEPHATLSKLSTVLLADDATFLHRLARHLRDGIGPARVVEAWELPGWTALIRWASERVGDLQGSSVRATFPLVEGAGFYAAFLGVSRAELRTLANLVISRVEAALRLGDESGLDDTALLRAFLVVLDLDLDRVRPLVHMLCGRVRRPDLPPPPPREQRATRLPASILAMSGPREDSPEAPWPDGPVEEPIRAFRDVALSVHGMVGLYNADPVLAIEVLLALLIEEPRSREPWWMSHGFRGFVLPGFDWAAKVSDGFFESVEVLAHEWAMLLAFTLKASSFAARALEVYRVDTRGPAEEPVRLEFSDGPRSYPGGRKLWSIGRGVDQPVEVLGYALKRLAEVIRAPGVLSADRALIIKLLLRCESTAALGFLCRMVTESPELIAGELSALLQDPRLSVWECERDPGRHPGALVLAARDAWFRAGWQWPALDRARVGWEASLAEGRCPEHLRGWTRNMVTWFERSRWIEERSAEGVVHWVWQPDGEQQQRNEAVGAMSQEVFGPLHVWSVARKLVEAGSPPTLTYARALFEAAAALRAEQLNAAEAQVAVACALVVWSPELLAEPHVLSTIAAWLELAFASDEDGRRGGVVLGHLDAAAAAALLWARGPGVPEARRVAGLAITSRNVGVVRTFFFRAAVHRGGHPGEFHRLLQFGFAFRAERRGDDAERARAPALAGLVADTGPAPAGPVTPSPAGHPDWLAPMTQWVGDAPRDAEVDAIVRAADACLRAEIARVLAKARERDGSLRKGRVTTPRDLDHPPSEYAIELLQTLAFWLLAVPPAQADAFISPWLDAESIPPEWLASLIDALYRAALSRPHAHVPAARLLTDVVGRVLDDPAWHTHGGGLLHGLEDRTLGVGYSGLGAEDWARESAPLLRGLRDLRRRWVERVRSSDSGVYWLTALGRAEAAEGTRSEFATLLVLFPPEARRRKPQAEHVAAFLTRLVSDPSFRRGDAAAEALLADVRAAGLPEANRLEAAMRGGNDA